MRELNSRQRRRIHRQRLLRRREIEDDGRRERDHLRLVLAWAGLVLAFGLFVGFGCFR